jgi:hypothetical protein
VEIGHSVLLRRLLQFEVDAYVLISTTRFLVGSVLHQELICRKLSFAIISETTPSADYTGHHALKAFGEEFYSGHVQSSYYEAERKLWTVICEDNDVEDYNADELLKMIPPAGLVDLHLSAALRPLKSKHDLISAYLHLGHPVDEFLSQDVLRKLFDSKNLTAK